MKRENREWACAVLKWGGGEFVTNDPKVKETLRTELGDAKTPPQTASLPHLVEVLSTATLYIPQPSSYGLHEGG